MKIKDREEFEDAQAMARIAVKRTNNSIPAGPGQGRTEPSLKQRGAYLLVASAGCAPQSAVRR